MESSDARSFGIGIAGALVGAVGGHLLFKFLLSYGVYAAALPGAAVGFAAGNFLPRRNIVIGWIAGIVALVVGVYSELTAFQFGDGSLQYFLTHPQPVTWLMLGLGTMLGFWMGAGRNRGF